MLYFYITHKYTNEARYQIGFAIHACYEHFIR